MATAVPATQFSQVSRTATQAATPAPDPRAGLAPLLFAACAYASGIIFGRYVWNPATWWMAAALALFALSLWSHARGKVELARRLTLILFALAGALGFQLASASAPAWQSNNLFAGLTDGREVAVTARVVRSGVFQGGVVPRESVDVESESIASEGSASPLKFGIRLSVYAAPVEVSEEELTAGPELPRFSYGQRIRFASHLRQPRNFMDAGAFDYRGYLAQQTVFALGSVRADRIERLPGSSGSRMGFWRSGIRGSLLNRIHALWPGRDGELMSAMLLGDRTGVDRETTIDYQRTEAYHILVVAGLKVGILAFALLWIFNLLRAPDWVATPLTIFATIAYAWITDANTPAARATLMLAVYLAARALYRERSPLNAVGVAALALLAWEPGAV